MAGVFPYDPDPRPSDGDARRREMAETFLAVAALSASWRAERAWLGYPVEAAVPLGEFPAVIVLSTHDCRLGGPPWIASGST